MTTTIELRGLTKRFRAKVAVHGLMAGVAADSVTGRTRDALYLLTLARVRCVRVGPGDRTSTLAV